MNRQAQPATPSDHIIRAMEEPTSDHCQRCRLSTAGWCSLCGGPMESWCCGRRWIELLEDGHHPECNYWTPQRNDNEQQYSLADIVAKHADTWHGTTQPGFRSCTCGQWADDDPAAQFSRASFGAHIQAEWLKACTIESPEQLNALPDLVAIRAGVAGLIWHKNGSYNPDEAWWLAGSDIERPTREVALPATLLWHPERDR